MMWQVSPGKGLKFHLAALSLSLLNRAGGENRMRNLMTRGKDRDSTYQLLSQAKPDSNQGKLIEFIDN